jgi:hypothetical protein
MMPSAPSSGRARSGGLGFLTVLGTLVFVITALAAGGVFLWKTTLVKQIETSKQNLVKSQERFDPATLEELKDLDTRIEAGKVLLNSHVSISTFFQKLSEMTLRTVRFRNLGYSYSGNVMSLTMKGEADSFNSIALQSDVFGRSQYFKGPIVSNLSLLPSGAIGFDFTAELVTSEMLYKKSPLFFTN